MSLLNFGPSNGSSRISWSGSLDLFSGSQAGCLCFLPQDSAAAEEVDDQQVVFMKAGSVKMEDDDLDKLLAEEDGKTEG